MNNIYKVYKYRAYPTKSQELFFKKTFGCVRFVYNRFLTIRHDTYQELKHDVNVTQCMQQLTQLKKEQCFLQEVDGTALQCALQDLDNAFQLFFKANKKYPLYKSKRAGKQSYTTKRRIRVTQQGVKLPKIGIVPCKITRLPEGRPLRATIVKSASGKYYISVHCTDVQHNPIPQTNQVVGIDVGYKHLITTSDGVKYECPKFLHMQQRKLKRLYKELSRKTKDGKNYNKQRRKIAALHEHIYNQRNDFLHKLSRKLVETYDIICTEQLTVSNMMREKWQIIAYSDAAWKKLLYMLEYKSKWYEKHWIPISRFYPSSQICSVCGDKNPALNNVAIRSWTCENCGTQHDRDINAATNILRVGLQIF